MTVSLEEITMPRKNRRAPLPVLPVILTDFCATVEGLWAIELTNGSGRKVIEVYGTKATAWEWAEIAGKRGGVAEGLWWPLDITSAANLVRSKGESFVLV